MPRTVYPTEEQANEDAATILAQMEKYFAKYYGPRCAEYEAGCPVCDVWKLYDEIKIIIK